MAAELCVACSALTAERGREEQPGLSSATGIPNGLQGAESLPTPRTSHPPALPGTVMVEIGLSATGTTFTQLQCWLFSHPL